MAWFSNDKKQANFFLSLSYKVMKAGKVPQHVAFIMDGNRRFAKKEHISRKDGHMKGFEKLTQVLHWCFELNIPEVTVYAFSIENFKRSPEEVDTLTTIFKEKLDRLLEEDEAIMKHGVCIRFIGDVTLFNDEIRTSVSNVVNLTKDNTKSFLNIAMAYTSRDEITHAIKDIAVGVEEGALMESDINEELIEKCFYTSECKPVDLLIRTSAEVRLSDFLLWQTSFSILCFVNALWPDFSIWDFFYCILKYQLGYNTMENSKELSKLREMRAQMETDLNSAYHELNNSSSVAKETLDATVRECTKQRKKRMEQFLENLCEKRRKLLYNVT